MSKYIEDLYYGNLEPQEARTSLTPKLKHKLKNIADKETLLMSLLSEDTRKMFIDYCDARNEFSSLSCADSFISGFTHGVRLTCEVFSND